MIQIEEKIVNFLGRTAALHTLGCKVNEYETDAMRSSLEKAGFTIVPFREKADVYVINTCSVTNIADRKSRQMISRAKKQNPDAVVIAAGCYVQTALERTGKTVDADILLGTGRKSTLVEEIEQYFAAMEAALEHEKAERAEAAEKAAEAGGVERAEGVEKTKGTEAAENASETEIAKRSEEAEKTEGRQLRDRQSEERQPILQNVSDVMHEKDYEELSLPRIEGHTRAWIKVQDGCNMFCSYCIIPFARGRIRSRRMEDILEELTRLAGQGIREVVITGIHLSSYGVDFAGDVDAAYGEQGERKTWQERSKLIDLIEAAAQVDGIERVRLGSLEPTIITEQFVERLGAVKEVCPHFHLSLQSGCDSVLKRMNRHYTAQEYLRCVDLLRKTFDEPAITTDVIVGFPGETEEEFECTRKFLEQVQFYETHLFRYSMRAGTKAAHMKDQIPERVKEKRLAVLAGVDRERRRRFEETWDGKAVEVLIEETALIDENGCVSVPNSGAAGGKAEGLNIELHENDKLYTGYTREYIRAFVRSSEDIRGKILRGKLKGGQIQG